MRFGMTSGLALSALIALVGGSVACSGGTSTVYRTGDPGAPGSPPDDTTTDDSATDPSQQGDPTDKETPSPPLVSGLAITQVAFFQAVKVSVVDDDAAVPKTKRNAPVVAGRPGLVRVYVTPDSSFKGGAVTAELRLVSGTMRLPILKDTKTLTDASTDGDTASTFNFEVPAESLPAGVTYQVLLTAKDGTVPKGASDARFPKDGGVQDLELESSGKLKIVVVPVKYDYDGSGRTPDVSANQLELYKKTFMARYPATEVVVTARAPWSWSQRISGNGTGFDSVLNAITNLRKTDNAPNDVYYYGALAPTQSFGSFCGGGCVTGLSTVVSSPKNAFLRASVGVGFPGDDSANTAAHEVGHAHGREHAPCGGTQGTDPDYPYSGGIIGVWGYDIGKKTFLSPTKGKDMMGYCPNEWVSDYTYTALFDRIAALNGGTSSASTGGTSSSNGNMPAASAQPTQTYRMASVAADGSVSTTSEIELDAEPADGESRLATYLGAQGQTIGTHTARFYPYDHLPGGILVVPSAPQAPASAAVIKSRITPTWSTIRVAGLTKPLQR